MYTFSFSQKLRKVFYSFIFAALLLSTTINPTQAKQKSSISTDGHKKPSNLQFQDPPAVLWSDRFGGSGAESSQELTTDIFGNVFITGEFNGTFSFGSGVVLTSAGGSDIFVAKFDAYGNYVWSRGFGDSGDDHGMGVATDGAGNVFVTGSFQGTVNFGGTVLTSVGLSDIFLVKYSPNGNLDWVLGFGNTDHDGGYSVAADSTDINSFVVITGAIRGSVDFGGGTVPPKGLHDVFLARFSNNGNFLSSSVYGGSGDDTGLSLVLDKEHNVYVTGTFHNTAYFGSNTPLISSGATDIFLAKYDPDGTHLWSEPFGGTTDDYGNDVATDTAGNVFLTGSFRNRVDFGGGTFTAANVSSDGFLAKYDPDGTHLWSKQISYEDFDWGTSVGIDSNGNAYITVKISPSTGFWIHLAKYSPNGNELWSKQYGIQAAGVYYLAQALEIDHQDNLLMTGYINGSINFGDRDLTSAGGTDIFLVKFGQYKVFLPAVMRQ